jgi:hypothetical protein
MRDVIHDARQPQAFGRFLLTLLGCRHAPTPQHKLQTIAALSGLRTSGTTETFHAAKAAFRDTFKWRAWATKAKFDSRSG